MKIKRLFVLTKYYYVVLFHHYCACKTQRIILANIIIWDAFVLCGALISCRIAEAMWAILSPSQVDVTEGFKALCNIRLICAHFLVFILATNIFSCFSSCPSVFPTSFYFSLPVSLLASAWLCLYQTLCIYFLDFLVRSHPHMREINFGSEQDLGFSGWQRRFTFYQGTSPW